MANWWQLRLRQLAHPIDNRSMSRKVWLAILAATELCLAGYFLLAFCAWWAKIYVFSNGPSHFSVMLIVWIVLSAAFFALYARTRQKLKSLDPK